MRCCLIPRCSSRILSSLTILRESNLFRIRPPILESIDDAEPELVRQALFDRILFNQRFQGFMQFLAFLKRHKTQPKCSGDPHSVNVVGSYRHRDTSLSPSIGEFLTNYSPSTYSLELAASTTPNSECTRCRLEFNDCASGSHVRTEKMC